MHQRREDAAAGRIARQESRIPLLGLIDFEDEAGSREHVGRQVAGVGIEADQLGEGVVLHLREQVQAVEALQVVETVAVLQLLELDFEDEVEGRAEHAAEGHDLFGQTADPEIDGLEAAERAAGVGARGVEEIQAVGRDLESAERLAEDDRHRRVALGLDRRRCGDAGMRAVGGDEVDDRGFVLEVAGEIHPALIRPQFLGVVAGFEEVAPRCVERRHAGIAATGEVDGGEIERQPEQVVAQRAGHEFVDLVADLPGHAADDVAGGNAVGDGVRDPGGVERTRPD